MEVIFNHQIHYHRDVIGTIGRARRKWKHLYHWYPQQQKCLYKKEMDRIYNETKEKYDLKEFTDYSKERRLNKHILKREHQVVHDKEDFAKFACLKPMIDKYDRIPVLYYYEKCGDPGFCQQQKDNVM